MALFLECMPEFAQEVIDTADIVREAMFQKLSCPGATTLTSREANLPVLGSGWLLLPAVCW